MTREKELLTQIKRFDREIASMSHRRKELALLLCPFKMGERIQCMKGRYTGQVWEIVKITPDYEPTDYRIFARKVLKGGGLGKLTHRWSLNLYEEMKQVAP